MKTLFIALCAVFVWTNLSAQDLNEQLEKLNSKFAEIETALETYRADIETEGKRPSTYSRDAKSGITIASSKLRYIKRSFPDHDCSPHEAKLAGFEKTHEELQAQAQEKINQVKREENERLMAEIEEENANEEAAMNEAMLSEEKPQEDFSSDFHRNHVGEIVFSKQMVSRENPGASLQGTFNATDRLYGRWFSDKSPTNQILVNPEGKKMKCSSCMSYFKIYVDGVDQGYKYDFAVLDYQFQMQTTRQIWLHPQTADGLTERDWQRTIANMSPGPHVVKVEYYAMDGEDYTAKMAEGSFTVNKKSGDAVRVGKSWSSFKEGMSDASLKSKILTLAKGDKTWKYDGTPEAVKITSTGWKSKTEKYTGKILYRYIDCQIKLKLPDGYCETEGVRIRQEYMGNGSYGSAVGFVTSMDSFGSNHQIDCD